MPGEGLNSDFLEFGISQGIVSFCRAITTVLHYGESLRISAKLAIKQVCTDIDHPS